MTFFLLFKSFLLLLTLLEDVLFQVSNKTQAEFNYCNTVI